MPTPTTRISFSEEHWLAIGAEDSLHRGPDLVQGAVNAGAVENERHQILRSLRRITQRFQPLLNEPVVATCAHLRHTLFLLALGFFGHLEKLDRQLRLVCHELVYTD